MVVSTLALAGCSAGSGSGVDWYVVDYEGGHNYEPVNVKVKSCHKIGDAITNYDWGVNLDEVWKCAVKLDSTIGFVDVCYVFHRAGESSINRKIRCAGVGPGCPLGGRRDREAQTVFLGREVDPTLAYEESLGNDPASKTVRVEVFYEEREGAKEHCGYLNVRVPIADDVDDPSQQATTLAGELIESVWDAPHYSFSYSLIND